MNQDSIQQNNIKLLNEAQEKVLMCKTYNVKYPISLEVSQRLYAVGCDNYIIGGYKGTHKLDAEAETIATVCNQ